MADTVTQNPFCFGHWRLWEQNNTNLKIQMASFKLMLIIMNVDLFRVVKILLDGVKM